MLRWRTEENAVLAPSVPVKDTSVKGGQQIWRQLVVTPKGSLKWIDDTIILHIDNNNVTAYDTDNGYVNVTEKKNK